MVVNKYILEKIFIYIMISINVILLDGFVVMVIENFFLGIMVLYCLLLKWIIIILVGFRFFFVKIVLLELLYILIYGEKNYLIIILIL